MIRMNLQLFASGSGGNKKKGGYRVGRTSAARRFRAGSRGTGERLRIRTNRVRADDIPW